MHEASIGGTNCANCDELLTGPFCAKCGQKAVALRPTLHDLTHEAVHEFAHVDGKIVRTLRLLVTSPGWLTSEFLRGRRARYITPIRLYLVCSLIFFATAALLPSRPLKVSIRDSSFERLHRGAAKIRSNPELLAQSFKRNLPKVAFVLMPVMGLLVFALYRRTEPTYVPHLYFSVHYHAFAFLLMTAIAGLTAIRSLWTLIPGVLLVFALIPYLVVALRRVYGGSVLSATLKGSLVAVAYGVIVLSSVTLLMLATVWFAA